MKKYTCTEDLYEDLKIFLNKNNINVGEIKKINYGIQFKAGLDTVRIFQSKKKGINIDTSQIKTRALINVICEFEEKQTNYASNILISKQENSMYNIAGSDEVGKGDYFAPLIVCALYADKNQYSLLKEIGVKDSKALNDKKIIDISKEIKKICPSYSIVKISQKKYNEMYEKIKNINIILAWAHSQAIKNLSAKADFKNVLIDKFGREETIKNNLKEYNLNLRFETKAESNLVVAGASILARNALLKSMKEQEEKYNMSFPLGAGDAVIATGKNFINKYSYEELTNVGKIHFKTTKDIKDKP